MCVLSNCVIRIETATLGYSFALRSLRPRNVVKYLTTVQWTTRPQCMGDGRGLPWALAAGH